MKTRDYRDFNQAMAGDFLTFVNNHPDAIDVLLFKPVPDSAETLAIDLDVVGALEDEERSLEYSNPIMSKAVIFPDEAPFIVADAGGEPDGNMDQPTILLLADPDIPKQSVVQYREMVDDTNIRVVSLYILRSEIVGEAPGACHKHYCLPFQVFDFEYIEPPVNVSPASNAEDIGETPTLTAGAFAVHGTNDTHGKSQWQIRAENDAYSDPAYDSEATADLTGHVVPVGNLDADTVYFWHVRYRGAAGDGEDEEAIWSDWSQETKFTTLEAFE